MATLTNDNPRVFEVGHDEELNGIAVKAATKIYNGAAVGKAAGLGRPLVAGDPFGGFATETIDNLLGADAAIRVNVKSRCTPKLNVVGVTGVANEGATVYAIDDNTFTLTAGANSPIGKILRWEIGTQCMVYCEATTVQSI